MNIQGVHSNANQMAEFADKPKTNKSTHFIGCKFLTNQTVNLTLICRQPRRSWNQVLTFPEKVLHQGVGGVFQLHNMFVTKITSLTSWNHFAYDSDILAILVLQDGIVSSTQLSLSPNSSKLWYFNFNFNFNLFISQITYIQNDNRKINKSDKNDK